MSGVLRLANTGGSNGRSTIVAAASTDATFTLPPTGGTILTTDFDTVGDITWNGSNINITNADLNVNSGQLFVDESTGFVGVNTTAPEASLEVNGNTVIGTNNVGLVEFTSLGVPYFAISADANNYRSTRINVVSAGGYADLSFDAIDTALKSGLPSAGSLVGNIMYLDASTQNVGIKTTSPQTQLHVAHNAATQIRIDNTSAGGNAALEFVAGGQTNPWFVYATDSRNLVFQDFSSERMRIDMTGNLGLGEQSPDSKFHIKAAIDSTGVGIDSNPIQIIQNVRANTGTSSAVLRLDTNEVSGTNQYARAAIGAEYDGSANVSGRLMFSTTNSSGDLLERLRINSAGRIQIPSAFVTYGSVNTQVKAASNATGAGVFGSLGNRAQTGFIYAIEIGTTNYLIINAYKRDSSTGVTTNIIDNNNLTVKATNAGGTVTLDGFTNSGNVKVVSFINQTQFE